MTALETLLAAIDAMRAACDRGSTCYEGCEAEHPRCAVYRAAEAVKAEGIPVPATLETTVCRWRRWNTEWWKSKCGHGFLADDVYDFCPACGGRIVEVTDGD